MAMRLSVEMNTNGCVRVAVRDVLMTLHTQTFIHVKQLFIERME